MQRESVGLWLPAPKAENAVPPGGLTLPSKGLFRQARPSLVVAPNFLLSIFRIPPTSEVWIHVVGVIAFNIGIYAWVAAKHENKPFLEASVYTRFVNASSPC